MNYTNIYKYNCWNKWTIDCVRNCNYNQSASPSVISPIRRGFAPSFVSYTKGCIRLAAAGDEDYQLLAKDRWFSPVTPASSTTESGRHDISEILLKVALSTNIWIQARLLHS